MEIEVLIRNLDHSFGAGVWIYRRDPMSNRIDVLKIEGNFKWEEYKVGDFMPAPIFSTKSSVESEIIFDKFIEAVKTAGYGKDRISVESGELQATKVHLEDMRQMAKQAFSALIKVAQGPQLIGAFPSEPDLRVDPERVQRAAKNCGQAAGVLKQIFPELFPLG